MLYVEFLVHLIFVFEEASAHALLMQRSQSVIDGGPKLIFLRCVGDIGYLITLFVLSCNFGYKFTPLEILDVLEL